MCIDLFITRHIRLPRRQNKLVFDYNSSLVRNLGSDVEGFFNIKDKTKLMAYFDQTSGKNFRTPEDLFQDDDDIVFMAKSTDFKKLTKVYYENKVYYETYGLDRDFLRQRFSRTNPCPCKPL
ncbi:MAG: hypothetical protein R2827_09240 [Bdellovibrionales bacterium]